MKKVIMSLLAILFAVSCMAQYVYQPEKIVKDDHLYGKNGKTIYFMGKDIKDSKYLIVEFNGKSQKELYTAMLLTLNELYPDFDASITKIEPEALTVNHATAFNKPYYCRENSNARVSAVLYRLPFKFKDGKLRIDLAEIVSYEYIAKIGGRRTIVLEKDMGSTELIDFDITNDMGKTLQTIIKKFCSRVGEDW